MGMLTGIAVGLLPVLPIYLGPFLIYFFMDMFPVEHLLAFWTCVLIGSQFFGSISTITLGIPGESSTLVYLQDIFKMSMEEKNSLLYQTAKGSFVAGMIGIIFLYLIVGVFKLSGHVFFSSIRFQIVAYTFAVLSFVFIDKKYVYSIILIALGIILGPKNNYVLPESWYKIQLLFDGTTLYMIILGMLILPQVILSTSSSFQTNGNFLPDKMAKADPVKLIKNTIIGLFSGLIPGPSAELASTIAYRLDRSGTHGKIIAAETANNSAVISLLIPFFLLGLPITQSTIIFSNIMDLKMINIPEILLNGSEVFSGLNIITGLTITLLCVTAVYYYLSINFIDLYVKFVRMLHEKMKIVMLAIVAAMVMVDVYVAEISIMNYLTLLAAFAALGILLEKLKVNPIPFMFAILLGDKLVWVYIQFYTIYF